MAPGAAVCKILAERGDASLNWELNRCELEASDPNPTSPLSVAKLTEDQELLQPIERSLEC
jgi:hypothetical protein